MRVWHNTRVIRCCSSERVWFDTDLRSYNSNNNNDIIYNFIDPWSWWWSVAPYNVFYGVKFALNPISFRIHYRASVYLHAILINFNCSASVAFGATAERYEFQTVWIRNCSFFVNSILYTHVIIIKKKKTKTKQVKRYLR